MFLLRNHKQTDQLHCHYCGSKSPYIKVCPACGSANMSTSSYGTEKIEEDIKKLFPAARVQRFDWDALKAKNKYQEIIRQFEKQDIDILVGTQMLVKGLDFEHVHLVGVMSADSILAIPDFRINERVFQMLEQVGGRAGRKKELGKVIIQLYNTEHPVIKYVQHHDYEGFYDFEMRSRYEFQYPPYTRMIKLVFKHKNQQRVQEAAFWFFEQIQELRHTGFFGPAEPSIGRIRTYFIQELILKLNKEHNHVQQVKQLLKDKVVALRLMKGMSQVIVQIDVDPQ